MAEFPPILRLLLSHPAHTHASHTAERPREERTFLLSEAMLLRISTYDAGERKKLKDGTEVRFGDTFGKIDIVPPRVPDGQNPTIHLWNVKKQILPGLDTLAALVKTEEALKNIQVFGGYSNLAQLAKRYGFEVSYIPDEEFQGRYQQVTERHVTRTLGENHWQGLKNYHHLIYEALMSRNELLKRPWQANEKEVFTRPVR